MAKSFELGVNLRVQEVLGLEQLKKQLSSVTGGAGSAGQVSLSVDPKGVKSVEEVVNALNKSKGAAKEASQAIGSSGDGMDKVTKAAKGAANATNNFGEAMYIAARRYAAFVVATGGAFMLVDQLKQATAAVIDFDLAMVKLDQTLDGPASQLEALRQKMLDLSTTTATSLKDLSGTSVTLAQAGYQAQDLTNMLEQLAKVPLLPSFDSIEQATDGVIAVQNQFKMSSEDTLDILDKLNNLANKYAVTSSDLIESVKRGGGTWASVNGTLDQYLALTTAVIQTTRESAETVGTAFKTITARLARPKTLSFLEGIGVQTKNAEGEFVGMYELLGRVSKKFTSSSELQKLDIAEQIGGARQVGKIVAMLNNWNLVERALTDSTTSWNSANQDAAKGLTSLSAQLRLLSNEAEKVYQKLAGTTFKPAIESLLKVGNAVVYVVDKLGPAIPLIGAFVAAWTGLKAVNIAGGLWGKFGSALSGAGIAGIGGSGGGIGGLLGGMSMATFLRGTPDTYESGGQLGSSMAPVKVPGKPSGISQIGRAAVSPTGQIAALIAIDALTPAIVDLTKKVTGAGDGMGDFAQNVVRHTSLLIGLISILKNQTIAQTIKGGVFGGTTALRSIALGTAAVAAVVATSYAESIDTAAEKRVQKIAKAIADYDFDPKTAKISEVLDATVGKSMKNIKKSFEEQSTMSYQAGANLKRALNLDFGRIFDFKVMNSEEIKQQIMKTVGSDAKKARDILTSSMYSFGENWRDLMKQSLEQQALDMGQTPESASKAASAFILALQEAVGGFKQVNALEDEVNAAIKNELKNNQDAQIARSLASFVIPPELMGSLRSFADAVEWAANATTASAQTFEGISAVLEGISPLTLPTEFAPKAMERLATQTPAFDTIFKNRPEIRQSVSTIEDMYDATIKFANGAAEGIANLNKQNKNLGRSDAFDMSSYVDRFFKSGEGQGLPQSVQERLKGFFKEDLGTAILRGLDGAAAEFMSPNAIKDIFDKTFKPLREAEKEQLDALQRSAQVLLTNAQFDIKKRAFTLQARAKTGVTGEGAIGLMNESLSRVGINVAGRQPADILQSESLMRRVTDDRVRNEKALAEAYARLTIAQTQGSTTQTMEELVGTVKKLSIKNLELAAAEDALIKAYPALLEKMKVRSEEVIAGIQRLPQNVPAPYNAPLAGRSFAAGQNIDPQLQLQKAQIEVLKKLQSTTTSPQVAKELQTRIQVREQSLKEYADRVATLYQEQEGIKSGVITGDTRERDVKRQAEDAKRVFEEQMRQQVMQQEIQQRMQQSVDAMTRAADSLAQATPSLSEPMNVFATAVTTFKQTVDTMMMEALKAQGNALSQQNQATQGYQLDDKAIEEIRKGVEAMRLGSETLNTSIQTLNSKLDALNLNGGETDSLSSGLIDELSSASSELATKLSETVVALNQGLKLQLDATQQFNVNVGGLSEAIQIEAKPALEKAASVAAKAVVKEVLYQLGKATGGVEEARTFNDVASGISEA